MKAEELLTEEQLRKVVEMYKKGVMMVSIEEKYRLPNGTIKHYINHLKKEGKL